METNEIEKIELNFTEKISNIRNLNGKLKESIEKSEEKLSNHCLKIKTQINEIAIILHNFINDSHQNLINEMFAYQKNFLNKFDLEKSDSKCDINAIITSTETFYSKWSNFLNNSYVYQKDETNKASRDAIEFVDKIEKEILEFEEKFSDKNLINFERNSQSLELNLIGCLKNQNYEYVTKIKTIQLEDIFQEITKPYTIKLEVLKNGKYILALYEERNFNFKVSAFDCDGNLLKTEDCLLRYPQKLQDFKIARSKDDTLIAYFAFIYGFYEMESVPSFELRKENIAKFLILRMDQNLIIMNKINLGFGLSMLCAFEENLYILSNWKHQGGDFKMFIYDWNLKLINELGDESDSDTLSSKKEKVPFQFSRGTRKFEVTSESFFLLEDFKIIMMDRKSGEILNYFPFNSFKFFISLNKYILTFNNFYRILYYFDFNGNLLYAKSIKNISSDALLVSILDERLFFFDFKSKTIFNFIN